MSVAETTNGESKAVATVKYDPLKPVGSAPNLKSLLIQMKGSIAEALPKHVTPERLIKTLLVAANRVPDLLKCTQASVLETINRAAELGLDLSGTLGEAYPVPFNNRIKTPDGDRWVMQCTLIIGYRGLAKLARQSGEIKRIEADVVCENDEFRMRKGSNAACDFMPALMGDRGKPIGAFAYVQFKDGGEQFDFMPVSDIDKIRLRSKSGSDKQGNAIGAWKTDWAEMAKKTVFRRLAKWLPLSTEKWQRAIEEDDDDTDLLKVTEVKSDRPNLTQELLGEDDEPPFGEPEPEVIEEPKPTPKAKSKPAEEPANLTDEEILSGLGFRLTAAKTVSDVIKIQDNYLLQHKDPLLRDKIEEACINERYRIESEQQ